MAAIDLLAYDSLFILSDNYENDFVPKVSFLALKNADGFFSGDKYILLSITSIVPPSNLFSSSESRLTFAGFFLPPPMSLNRFFG